MRNKKHIKRNRIFRVRGFTLIELLVVMVIIGVLSTFGVTNYMEARARARDAQRKSNILQIQSALELYRADQLKYPTSLPSCNNALVAGGITYMKKTPCDPGSSSTSYIYIPSPAPPPATVIPTSYTLVACLENANDAQQDSPTNSSCATASYSLSNP